MKAQSLLLIVLISVLTSCGKVTTGTDEGSRFKVIPLRAQVDFPTLKKELLVPHCVSCHAWAATEAGVATFLVAGNPDASEIYKEVNSGSMPQGSGRLPQGFVDLLKTYILGLSPTTPTPTPAPGIPFESIKGILVSNCLECHKWADKEAGVQRHMLAGDPDNSPLFQEVDSGRMPEGGERLPQPDIDKLREYILALGPTPVPTPEPTPVPTPIPTPEPTPTPGEVVAFSQIKGILETSCLECHRWAGNEAMLKRKLVPGDPAGSPLFQEVDSGRMPEGGPRLDQGSIDLIRDYIKGLAQAPVPTPTPKPEPTPAPGIQATFSSIKENMLKSSFLGCHSGARPGLPNLSDYAAVKASAAEVLYTMTEGRELGTMPMPPLKSKAPVPSKEAIQAFKDWMAAGFPE